MEYANTPLILISKGLLLRRSSDMARTWPLLGIGDYLEQSSSKARKCLSFVERSNPSYSGRVINLRICYAFLTEVTLSNQASVTCCQR